MPTLLTLLDGVRWSGSPVPGERPQALLAALADAGRTVGTARLAALVWGEDQPVNPVKAVQVLVSRLRPVVGTDRLVREGEGYRLLLDDEDVDARALDEAARRARAVLDTDPAAALTHAERALAVAAAGIDADAPGPLGDVRRRARAAQAQTEVVRCRALSRCGRHAEALAGLLAAAATSPTDEALLVDLLRSEAAVRSPAAALERYEEHRARLSEQLGTDPGPELRRLHGELLALDRPVRHGVHYDSTPLLGRDDDLRALAALLATSRVVSVVGPGGLGKTTLAHSVARAAPQPVVHFVELVGITAAEDLLAEVGSALGVRDSVSGRRTLTARQRADARARIAQQLDQAPTLLVLDNCEHVVEAVADLVAFLVATTRELRVLTTSRAPLRVAAERVHLLPHLGADDSVRLFRTRAEAARPGVRLEDAEVRAVVARLDGLPLAIELAAAKVRVMGPAEIARRLDDRFALLRGGARGAPDLHRTLLAVIDWSWNLLPEADRRGLRLLSAFGDGFTLEAADELLGHDALETVEDLVAQSLLTVTDVPGGTRFRMLETVREFGALRRQQAGESEATRVALRGWAVALAAREGPRLFAVDQAAAMDRLRAEETNLADVLREAMGDGDAEAVAVLFATLGGYWMIRGDHFRSMTVASGVAAVLRDWPTPPALADTARAALCVALANTRFAGNDTAEHLADQLAALGPGDQPALVALVRITLAQSRTAGEDGDLMRLVDDPDPWVRTLALQWAAHHWENQGDPPRAVAALRAALALGGTDEGPWRRAMLDAQLAELHAQLGDFEQAAAHAAAALGVLERLGAFDDLLQNRAIVAMAALNRGEMDTARRLVGDLRSGAPTGLPAGDLAVLQAQGELALANGEVAEGLRLHRAAAEAGRALRPPGSEAQLLPWTIAGTAAAVCAFAYHGSGADGQDLRDAVAARAGEALDPAREHLDFPVAGLVLFSLGLWALLRRTADPADAVRVLVLAERFSYHRFSPTLGWERARALCEQRAPGVLARLAVEYDGRRGPELLPEARAAVERVR